MNKNRFDFQNMHFEEEKYFYIGTGFRLLL